VEKQRLIIKQVLKVYVCKYHIAASSGEARGQRVSEEYTNYMTMLIYMVLLHKIIRLNS